MRTAIPFLTTILCASITGTALAQCDTGNADFDNLAAQYESRYRQLEEEGATIDDETPQPSGVEVAINADVDVKWENKKFIIDLVSVTMKDKKISFSTPQMTMKTKSMVFSKPEVVMVAKKIGQRPVVVCKGLKCTTKWKDIITHVPTTRMKRVEIKTDLPEFRYAVTSFVTGIPQIRKDRKEITMKLPEVTIKKVTAETEKVKEKAGRIENESNRIADEQEEAFSMLVHQKFECQRENLITSRQAVDAQFEAAISELNSSIERIKNSGADPAGIKSDDGTDINLYALREELFANYKASTTQFNEALESLDRSEKEILEGLAVK